MTAITNRFSRDCTINFEIFLKIENFDFFVFYDYESVLDYDGESMAGSNRDDLSMAGESLQGENKDADQLSLISGQDDVSMVSGEVTGNQEENEEEEEKDDHPHDREPKGEGEEDDEEPEEDWGYKPGYLIHTPSAWGNMYPICDEGEFQSPINVEKQNLVHTPNLPPLHCHYRNKDLCKLLNTGKNLVIEVEKDPSFSQLRGGPLPKDSDFRLCEIGFHWGVNKFSGSEHKFDGQSYAGELQFVHLNVAKYEDFDAAFASDEKDGICVVSRFIRVKKLHEMEEERTIADLYRLMFDLFIINGEEAEPWVPLIWPPVDVLPQIALTKYFYYRVIMQLQK